MYLIKYSNSIWLFLILHAASVCAYNRTTSNFVGHFNKPYVNSVVRKSQIIYSFDLPDKFDPLVKLFFDKLIN